MILSIDPGNKKTAFLFLEEETGTIAEKDIVENHALENLLSRWRRSGAYDVLAIESIQSFGMPVGREIFDTCIWIGRFIRGAKSPAIWPVYRTQVKAHFCPDKPNDSGVRQAMCARYGGDPRKSKQAGNLSGVVADIWSALAIASYVSDMRKAGKSAMLLDTFLFKPR